MDAHDRDPFAELADEAAAEEAVRRRVQARWLRRQAAEEATLLAVVLDLAEAGAEVAVRSASGRVARGPIARVGEDFVVVGSTWMRLAAVVAVRAVETPAASRAADIGASAGARAPSSHRVRLAEALAELAAGDRPAVVVVPLAPGDPLRGELVAVGVDVLTLALDGDRRARSYVPIDAVGEVVVGA